MGARGSAQAVAADLAAADGAHVLAEKVRKIVTPDDIGGVFAFLASDAARWITGHTIAVDGGSKL